MAKISLSYKQRDILLVPFPFSDQSGKKVRPVLVLSNDSFNAQTDDILVCALTTTLKKNSYSLFIEKNDLEEGILYQPSCIKIENLLKLNKYLILKKIGALNTSTFQSVKNILFTLF